MLVRKLQRGHRCLLQTGKRIYFFLDILYEINIPLDNTLGDKLKLVKTGVNSNTEFRDFKRFFSFLFFFQNIEREYLNKKFANGDDYISVTRESN